MNQRIILRIPLDRPPTFEDRWNQVGAEEFSKRLQEAGWATADGIVIKPFRVDFEGHTDGGEFYIQWTAILEE